MYQGGAKSPLILKPVHAYARVLYGTLFYISIAEFQKRMSTKPETKTILFILNGI